LAALYDSAVTVPGQTIGNKGPGCLGLIGLSVLALVIVSGFAIAIFVHVGPFFNADKGGNTGNEVCTIVHNVDGSSTQNCSHPIKVSP
jgi:hypothetical protein